MTVLDLSNYDSDIIGNAMCLKVGGVTGAIVGCQRPDTARQQIDALRAVGIATPGVYAFLYFGIDSTGQTGTAIKVAQEKGIRRVWLDVESSGTNERAGITPPERIAELNNCLAMVRNAGLEPGIYTYEPYWRSQMADTHDFAALPLWFANYGTNDPNNPRPPVNSVSFGGWTSVTIHQYSSTIRVCGRERDHNYVFEGEDDMTPEEVNKLVEKFVGATFPAYIEAYFSGGFSARNGVVSDLNPEGKGPIKPWLADIPNLTTLPQVAADQ